MIKKIFIIGCVGFALFIHKDLFASTIPYYDVGIYGGYGSINNAYKSDGDFAQGRLAFGAHIKQWKQQVFGGEIGMQSGNSMRYILPTTTGSNLNLPVQTTLKPVIDLLATMTAPLFFNESIHYIFKGGIAYRQLDMENATSTRDILNQVAGEFQAGLSFNINPHLIITAFYQGIYANNGAVVSTDANNNNFYLNHIPTQQTGFFGIEYQFSEGRTYDKK